MNNPSGAYWQHNQEMGNSEQCVLELCDGRRVAVLIQISLPLSDAVDDFVEQNQLAVVLLMTSDSIVGIGLCLFLNEFEVAIAYLEG